MALRVERFIARGKGNGLRAVGSAATGELLYTGSPLACCVSKNCLSSACHNCFASGSWLLWSCSLMRYFIQKQAWLEHKRECKYFKSLQPRVPPDSVRLAARIIFTLVSSQDLYSIMQHESHLEDMSKEKTEGLAQLASILQLCVAEEARDWSLLPPGLDPIGLIARVTCNCFTISDGELQEIGVGLYPSMSLLNHNCRPNCVMLFEGKTIYLRAIRDIQAQEELTISYTDALFPRAERCRRLQEQYHFLCVCQHCSTAEQDADMLAGDEEAWISLKDAVPRLESLQLEQKWDQILTECQALVGRHGGAVPDRNVYLLRLLDLALDACISLGQFERALLWGRRTLEPYELYYSDPHPARAVQLMRVGKLQRCLGRVDEALETFRQAYDIMKVTHGSDHTLTNELRGSLEEFRAELNCTAARKRR
uniref:[histone H3]-lysine(4) N-trimethyltransferase n=1 Tax=Denticeps clupeoides TaxID=299321 RepID=A0AAY4BFL2_9TELE